MCLCRLDRLSLLAASTENDSGHGLRSCSPLSQSRTAVRYSVGPVPLSVTAAVQQQSLSVTTHSSPISVPLSREQSAAVAAESRRRLMTYSSQRDQRLVGPCPTKALIRSPELDVAQGSLPSKGCHSCLSSGYSAHSFSFDVLAKCGALIVDRFYVTAWSLHLSAVFTHQLDCL